MKRQLPQLTILEYLYTTRQAHQGFTFSSTPQASDCTKNEVFH